MILTTLRKKVGVIYALFFTYFSLPNEKNTLHIFFVTTWKKQRTKNKKQTQKKKTLGASFIGDTPHITIHFLVLFPSHLNKSICIRIWLILALISLQSSIIILFGWFSSSSYSFIRLTTTWQSPSIIISLHLFLNL